jgi:triosephosphate isomerase
MNLEIETALELAAACAEMANATAGSVGIGIAAPALWLPSLAIQFSESNLLLGAQDVSAHQEGAYTGEISAAMLAPWCTFSLVGHSERREYHRETNAEINVKIANLHANELTSVLCVGESMAERSAGNAELVVTAQLEEALQGHKASMFDSLIVAYEPVWAIGSGTTPQPDDVQAMAAYIRAVLAGLQAAPTSTVPILYGGSVNGSNASTLLAVDDIDGALAGGASLNADAFVSIIEALA